MLLSENDCMEVYEKENYCHSTIKKNDFTMLFKNAYGISKRQSLLHKMSKTLSLFKENKLGKSSWKLVKWGTVFVTLKVKNMHSVIIWKVGEVY